MRNEAASPQCANMKMGKCAYEEGAYKFLTFSPFHTFTLPNYPLAHCAEGATFAHLHIFLFSVIQQLQIHIFESGDAVDGAMDMGGIE